MQAFVSLYSADPMAIGEAVAQVDRLADGFHVDVFDGHAVPELLFGPDFVTALKTRTTQPIEVHLMVSDGDYWAQRFSGIGADIISLHAGSLHDPHLTFAAIRESGGKASLCVEITQAPEHMLEFVDSIDRLLVMGTPIGVKGVGIDPNIDARLRRIVELRREAGRTATDLPIFVDGGIRTNTVARLAAAGADGVIPGSFVFGVDDPTAAIRDLHALEPSVVA
jgi:ribulose-phosphate 3-epimerase